ncbi:predicted protein [Uncinocarpus reesii 1704]|uniref:BTB domain-containing protein n=1 Tax=Uncinocarpus reesii (strain UAMH 1704) TaxID=336963 RepID=C4JH26_UNCRE|nr:uncharacterized protein UREG_01277 [Uncinocarpus reesii 1704]EEP76428.1 predicted protein [Uncinocarpus reesii 1704]
MPSTLRTPSPIAAKPVKRDSAVPDIYRLDPDGDITLVLTRFVTYVDEDDEILGTKAIPQADTGDDGVVEEEVIIHASSRHMILASPVFRAMLQRKFSESNTLQLTGRVEIRLPDDDPDALLILLNIIHGHVRKVPLSVDLITLIQLAILVDKYDIHEAVELFSNFWFDNLKSTIPGEYTDDIPAWICICWVFDRPNEFKVTTHLALRQGKQAITSGELPIPSSVVEAINSKRQEALHKLLTTLYGHLDDYMENEHCSFECDALMLGSLTKRLRALKIFPLRPDPPYSGLCFEEFDYRFRQGMYFPGAQRTSAYFYEHSKCAIRSLDTTLLKCEEKLLGLDMRDYK